ncbi:MAG: YigZ family protein [Lachnospiraceae bacterium]|nr:YigZ family protein [Lachnospiraceae bacterium]MBP5184202.1 YigZ family protein [Lachnospiraceae bacterium]
MGNTDYKCIITGGTGEITEKKSRFIASVAPVSSEEEALAFIEEVRKANRTARHNCYAYTLGVDPALTRFSDDGEPAGTAGRPMLDCLLNEELHNTCVVVTRYFGGILLGTGGLVRAYTQAVKEGLAASGIATKLYGRRVLVKTDYSALAKLQRIAFDRQIPILSTDYTEEVLTTLFLRPGEEQSFTEKLLDQTQGKAVITPLEYCYYAEANGTGKIFDK